jgi:ComF family protein
VRIRSLLSGAADFLLPRVCVACGELLSARDAGVVCGLCWSRVVRLPEPLCRRCGHPQGEAECRWCDNLRPFVRAARSFCWYPGEPVDSIVAAMKYGGWHVVADSLAQRMSRLSFPDDVRAERPVLVPVPLSRTRERERGYNQSELIARALARRWDLRVMVDCLRRSRSTVSQTQLTPGERSRNVAGAFTVNGAASSLHGAHVLLVDDVVTTAATLNECGEALFQSGARIVSYITFGRARAPGDQLQDRGMIRAQLFSNRRSV